MRFSKSQRRADLIFMSIGVSQFRDGLRLTSKSQGFKSESIKISKPEIKVKLLSFYMCFSVFPKSVKYFLCELGMTQNMQSHRKVKNLGVQYYLVGIICPTRLR